MFSKKIYEKLHKLLFSSFDKKFIFVTEKFGDALDDIEELRIENQRLLDLVKKPPSIPEAQMSDLMRANLGLVNIDFTNVDDAGIPKHFLDTEDPNKRTQYINELYQIYQFEVFHVMCQNHINTQGNFSFRNSDGYEQMLAGRMSVNGISLIKNDVMKGYLEYVDRSKPPEDFDKFETTEGISIKKEE